MSNHESIFTQGMLIPGEGNDIKVANGSAHGNGVYVAKLSNPWLSQGFVRGANKMLICGVVDDAKATTLPQRFGFSHATRESNTVRHVGDAMVVFDSSCVAPLFVAEWTSEKSYTGNPASTKHRVPSGTRTNKAKERVPRGTRTNEAITSPFWVTGSWPHTRYHFPRSTRCYRTSGMNESLLQDWSWKSNKHKRGAWLRKNFPRWIAPRWWRYCF